MKLLYKPTSSSSSTSVEVKDTSFINHYPTLHKNTSWEMLKPFIRQATQEYILPYIGEDLYTLISDKYDDNMALSAIESTFFLKLQDSIAYYTVYHALPHLNITAGEMGVNQLSSNSKGGNVVPISQWAFKNTLYNTIHKADCLLDDVLNFMENNRENVLFSGWAASEFYLKGSDFFKQARVLNGFVNIKNSIRTFWGLIPLLNEAANIHLKPVLGSILYGKLKSGIKDNSITDVKELELIELCRQVNASLALAEGINRLTFIIESDGLRLHSFTDGLTSKNSINTEASFKLLLGMQAELIGKGKMYKADLINFLYTNAEAIPEFKESQIYTEGENQTFFKPSSRSGGILL